MTRRALNFVGVGLLSVALSATWMAAPVSAQVDDALDAAPVVQRGDDGFDWGWLGLLGLIGLAGLMRRDRHHADHRRDTAATTTATRP